VEERERGGRRGRGEDRPIEREGTCTMSRASGRREPSSSRQSGGPQSVGNYTLLEVLGQGTFGEVLLAVERHTHESVAVKVLERDKIADDDARQRLANEISILHRVHHTHLLQLLEVIEEVDRIYLVTEHVGGGELFNYIVEKGRLDEAEAAKLFSQMVAAVDSCHRNLVIHRDLKPENLLLDANGDIKVIDFGLGTILSSPDEILEVACGSPHYAAPEMLLGGGYLGQRVDMWALGVCLYAMLCGCLPFDEPDMEVLYDRIIAGDFDFSPAPKLSAHAKDLINGLLHMPPEERITARAVLNHKWLRSTAPSPPATLGLMGAVLDPACRQLLRKMEADYGMDRRVVLEALRRGERGPHTAIYWLLRQRELKRGSIVRFVALKPKPPPPRQGAAAVRRRPVPAHIRAAAGRLPPPSTQLPYLPLAALSLDSSPPPPPLSALALTARVGSDAHGARSIVRNEDLSRQQREEARTYVHNSGAVTDRSHVTGGGNAAAGGGGRRNPPNGRATGSNHATGSGGATTSRHSGGANAELFQIAARGPTGRRPGGVVEVGLGASLGIEGKRYQK